MSSADELHRIVKDLVENKHSEVPVWRTQTVCAKILLCCADLAESQPLFAAGHMKQQAHRLLQASRVASDE